VDRGSSGGEHGLLEGLEALRRRGRSRRRTGEAPIAWKFREELEDLAAEIFEGELALAAIPMRGRCREGADTM